MALVERTKKYWKEILFFSIIATVYTICTSPGFTWSCMDNDCFNFVWAAKFVATPHLPGYPWNTLLNILFIRIPIGMEGWRLAWFGSTIPSIISCILIFLIVRKSTNNRWSPYVSSISLAGCNVFFVQSIIPEVYSFAIMCMLFTYWAFTNKKEKTTALLAGVTAGTHPFAFPAVFFMVFFGVRKRWWWIPVLVTIGLYSYCFLRNEAFIPYFPFAADKVWIDFGGLSAGQFIYRLRDTAILLCVGFGLTLIPAFMFLKDIRRSWMMWLSMIIPISYWMTTNVEVTYVHFLIALPWVAISAGLGLDRIKIKPALVFGVSLVLLLAMPFFYDIGNTMDKNLSAQKFYDALHEIPDGSIVTNMIYIEKTGDAGIDERSDIAVMVFNRSEGKELIALHEEKYLSLGEDGTQYRKFLREEYHINTPIVAVLAIGSSSTMNIKAAPLFNIMRLIVNENPGRKIYYSRVTEENPMDRYLTEFK